MLLCGETESMFSENSIATSVVSSARAAFGEAYSMPESERGRKMQRARTGRLGVHRLHAMMIQ